MTEITTLYLTENKEFASTAAFTLYQKQIAEISDLQQREGRKRSAIVQDAIDLYYEASDNEKLGQMRTISGLTSLESIERALDQLFIRLTEVTATDPTNILTNSQG
jgi:hypothetical protein